MPDIIITIAKDKIKEEALKVVKSLKSLGREEYYRQYSLNKQPPVRFGDKVFILEDGYVRGFFVVQEVRRRSFPVIGTADQKDEYSRVIFDVLSWQSIVPIPMNGFPGFKYVLDDFTYQTIGDGCFDLEEEIK